jgi:hypothetical protein
MIYLARLKVFAAYVGLTVRLNAFSRKPDRLVLAGRTIKKAKKTVTVKYTLPLFIPE